MCFSILCQTCLFHSPCVLIWECWMSGTLPSILSSPGHGLCLDSSKDLLDACMAPHLNWWKGLYKQQIQKHPCTEHEILFSKNYKSKFQNRISQSKMQIFKKRKKRFFSKESPYLIPEKSNVASLKLARNKELGSWKFQLNIHIQG